MSEPTAYPLCWPRGVPRHKGVRLTAAFSKQVSQHTPNAPDGVASYRSEPLSIADGVARIQRELNRFGAVRLVISTNVAVRRDGLPYSTSREPADPGVAVYFHLRTRPYCLPCDRWTRVADNLAAVAAHIAALRGIERWGVGTVEQAFTGYLALPSPDDVDWRAEFPRVETLEQLEERYREQAKKLHPDAEGTHEAMVRLNRARQAARAELGA
jgi:hypothetical protein